VTRIRWIVASVAVVVVGLGVLLAVNLGGDPTKVSNATVGHLAPDFRLTSFDHKSIDLSQLRGRVVLVNFWNDWCQPCQQETPSLNALAKAHQNDPGFAIIGIVHDPQTHGAVTQYAKQHNMTYPLAFDPGERTSLDYGVTGQPETFLVDKAGVVNKWVSGPIDPNDIERQIEQLEAT
jgi:cytochrome c biogenesis protein CcmG/thiol:disulfide interchange protein DsbE